MESMWCGGGWDRVWKMTFGISSIIILYKLFF